MYDDDDSKRKKNNRNTFLNDMKHHAEIWSECKELRMPSFVSKKKNQQNTECWTKKKNL